MYERSFIGARYRCRYEKAKSKKQWRMKLEAQSRSSRSISSPPLEDATVLLSVLRGRVAEAWEVLLQMRMLSTTMQSPHLLPTDDARRRRRHILRLLAACRRRRQGQREVHHYCLWGAGEATSAPPPCAKCKQLTIPMLASCSKKYLARKYINSQFATTTPLCIWLDLERDGGDDSMSKNGRSQDERDRSTH